MMYALETLPIPRVKYCGIAGRKGSAFPVKMNTLGADDGSLANPATANLAASYTELIADSPTLFRSESGMESGSDESARGNA